MKAYWGSGGIAPLNSLASALNGDEWLASRPGRFTPKERAPGIHWIGGWVCPRAVLDAVVKRKIPSTRRESNPRTPIVQPVAQRCTDWAVRAVCVLLKVWRSFQQGTEYVALVGLFSGIESWFIHNWRSISGTSLIALVIGRNWRVFILYGQKWMELFCVATNSDCK
jgi:hypothetical protein